jgi:YVTN family beta-propeller protein
MRRIPFANVLILVSFAVRSAAAPKPDKSSLVPLAQSTRESRQADVQACISQATADASSHKPLDDDAMLLLHGHHTERFVRNGRPVVDRNYVPAPWKSLVTTFVGPAALSDRYVVCLLKRGYRWPDNPANSPGPAQAPPQDVQSGTKPNLLESPAAGEKSSPNDSGAAPKSAGHPEMTKIALGYYTQGIAFTPGAIWVAFEDEKNHKFGVFRVDPSTNQMVTSVLTGKEAGWAAAGEGAVWIGNFGDNSVSRVDPETNKVVATVAVGKSPFGVAVGEGSVWVTNARGNTVSRIDPKTNAVIATIPVGKRPAGIAIGGGFVWVANWKSKSVSRIDPMTNAVVAIINVEGEPEALTARGNDVWASCQLRSGLSVQRIDAKSNSVVAKTMIGTNGHVGGAALLDGVLWVADRAGGALWRINTETNTVVGEPVPVGFDATIVGVGADGNGAIWLSNSAYGTVRKVKP